MGAQKSVRAGKAKIDVNVDLTHKLCASLMLPSLSITAVSIVRDMPRYQAFAIGGIGSVRGYGEGGVGAGRSCQIANTELSFPLNNMLNGCIFLDCGTDLGSGRHVSGNPSLRNGKPGSGVGLGYGRRFKSKFGYFQITCGTGYSGHPSQTGWISRS